METTGAFRSWRDVEELWDVVVSQLTIGIDNALKSVNDPELFLRAKENLSTFVMALEVSFAFLLTRLVLNNSRHRHTPRPPCRILSCRCLNGMSTCSWSTLGNDLKS